MKTSPSVVFIFLLPFLLLLLSKEGKTQDYHFSQYFNSPLTLNPALAGDMREDIRASFLHRRQWYNAAVPFNTTAFGADMNFYKVPFWLDRMGMGVNLLSEDMGSDFFKNQQALLTFSLGKSLDKKQKHFLSFGIQGGVQRKSLVTDNLYYESQFNEYAVFDRQVSSGETYNGAWDELRPQLNLGVNYHYHLNETTDFAVGVSSFNTLGPKDDVLGGVQQTLKKRPLRWLATSSLTMRMSEHWDLVPTFLFGHQRNALEANLGGLAVYHFGIRNIGTQRSLRMGVFHRYADSFIALLGLRMGAWQADFSYDVGMSGLNKAANLHRNNPFAGSFEVSLTYRGFLNRLLPERQSVPCHFF